MNVPVYLWGHAGVGKTTMYEQISAITKRPYVRVQHTANMEEADVEGRWIVNAKNQMEFQNGPLTDAMEQGMVYCADEYDFASPMILSVYRAVLEGKPLFIKSANKKVVPHPNFRFVASGNTNGAGDETGLYQGTMMQNAANYERFGVVERVNYMPAASEVNILTSKTSITKGDAENVVKFANLMRESFDKKDVAIPMSPRSTLNARSWAALALT
ncbi:DNA polymerase III subunit alpha [Xanthomonas phage JGB6]|nr:DNA polymerase III subunit alpha [Xanthomonas phage JGB6]